MRIFLKARSSKQKERMPQTSQNIERQPPSKRIVKCKHATVEQSPRIARQIRSGFRPIKPESQNDEELAALQCRTMLLKRLPEARNQACAHARKRSKETMRHASPCSRLEPIPKTASMGLHRQRQESRAKTNRASAIEDHAIARIRH